jgi:hypothetical protein
MGHHQATLIIWGDHCTVHFDLSTLRHIVIVVVVVVVVVVVNLLRRIFSSFLTVVSDCIFKLSLYT